MRTVRRFLGTIFLVLTVTVSAATTKIEVVPVEAARSAPSALPALQMPLLSPAAVPFVAPAVPLAPQAVAAQAPSALESASRDEEPPSGGVSSLFDGGFADKTSLPEEIGLPDIIPEWPAQPGAAVRVAGRTYVLGERLGEVLQSNGHRSFEGTNPVYRVEGEPLVVKFIYPPLKNIEIYGGEREALVEMDKTPIAHSRLKASSKDGLVLVKELVVGEPLYRVTAEGPLSREQRVALLEMAALYVSLGRTADLNLTNLVWQEQEKRLVLIDSGGFAFAQPWAPLGQILSRRNLFGIDGTGFLSALRKRLGPDSPAWRAVETSAQAPAHKTLIEDLRRRNAASSFIPKIFSFRP